eukprot:TRINITY_DN59271_c0_g1_i1.p1 TRINITY_DN59271_c0_g1~~TRINITY_DN59271_c0_g1_i1.p1  ORF type:complete len:488 (+),score=58.35 TRINITY_DN59271_c0_g1_i1:77-1540(+)
MIHKDADAESSDAAGRNCSKADACHVFSLQQVTTSLSIGSWLLLCVSDATTITENDDDRSLWSPLLGGGVLFVALALLIVSNLQACRRKSTLVLPMNLEPKDPGSSRWHFVIHGHLVLGSLLWISVHVASKQGQQVWRGMMTFYTIIVGSTVICYHSRGQASESDCDGQTEVSTGRNAEKNMKVLSHCSAKRWQPMFTDPTFGFSVEGAPLVGRHASLNMMDDKQSMSGRTIARFSSGRTHVDDVDESRSNLFGSRSIRTRASFRFVEHIAVVPQGSPCSNSSRLSRIPHMSRSDSQGMDLLVPPSWIRQCSQNSASSRRSVSSESLGARRRRLSQSSALSDVSLPSEPLTPTVPKRLSQCSALSNVSCSSQIPRGVSRSDALNNVSALPGPTRQRQPSKCSAVSDISGLSPVSLVCASQVAQPEPSSSIKRSSSGGLASAAERKDTDSYLSMPEPNGPIFQRQISGESCLTIRSVASSEVRREHDS